MSAPLIAINTLTHRYGANVTLELDQIILPPGTTAVLGPNGAGKTTLLRAVATVSPLQSGSILIDGADVSNSGGRLSCRRRLGYVGQHDSLPARMRVSEFCNYVGALKEIGPVRRRRRWTAWVLSEVGLTAQASDRISTLSGGMRRRLSLAQALLGQPDLMVLDEPLVSLDAAYRSTVVRMIAESADTRTTVVATHHTDELAAVCQHVIVLLEGRLVFAGPPRQLAQAASGKVWETIRPIDHPSVRALGPDRFRIVGERPQGATPAEPTVHDGYLSLVSGSSGDSLPGSDPLFSGEQAE